MPQGRCGVCAVPVARLVAALSLPKFGSEYSNIHEDLRGASTVTNDLSNRLGRVPFVDDALTALDALFPRRVDWRRRAGVYFSAGSLY
jgi:hypothetical protein